VPVFIYAPEEEGQFQPGRCSRWWLRQSLAALATDLAALGGGGAGCARVRRLLLRRGPASLPALRQLAAEAGATALVFNHLYDPISLVRDDEVKACLAADGLWVQVGRSCARV
jgi:deoxyribodipyrimidine photolyase